jgi:hypothetical protein
VELAKEATGFGLGADVEAAGTTILGADVADGTEIEGIAGMDGIGGGEGIEGADVCAGAEEGRGAILGAWGKGASLAAPVRASSCQIKRVMAAEESVPHAGQMNCTPSRAISGVTSKEYFAPQEH